MKKTAQTTNTMTITKGYTMTAKTDDNGVVITKPVKVSDSASVDAPVYVVEFKTAQYMTPASSYLLDADAFAKSVNDSAIAFVVNDIRNVIAKLTTAIDSAKDSDSTDVKSIADKIAQRDALDKFVAGKRKSTSTDTIATAFAFSIVCPKFAKYTDSDRLIDAIRTAYADKTMDALKSTRDAVQGFASKYISVDDDTKSTVYKNVRCRLSLGNVSRLIDVVSASPLAYTRKGIIDRRMSTNKAVVQLMLFVLRETFELTTTTVKTDSASYMVIG